MSKTATEQFFELLGSTDIQITFSINCRSGLVGDMCRCARCLKGRSEAVNEETEHAAEREAKLTDRAFKNGYAMGQLAGSMALNVQTEINTAGNDGSAPLSQTEGRVASKEEPCQIK